MARYTTAYSSFIERLDEIHVLRKSAAAKARLDPIKYRREINALCRGAIVLLSSHVEAYVKELGEVALEAMFDRKVDRKKISRRIFYHVSRELLENVSASDDPEKVVERTFFFIETDGDLWSKDGEFPRSLPSERFNRGFSNPKFEKIRSYFQRFGYSNYKNEIQAVLKARSAPVINLLDHLVDMRNSIAHGDPSASKTPDEIDEMINLITIYCRTTDVLFADWCQQSMCRIRR